MKSSLTYLAYSLIFISIALLVINVYGLTQSLRPNNIGVDELRFREKDVTIDLDSYFEQAKRLPAETDAQFSERLTKVIASGTAHIHWDKYPPRTFNQLVPIWENWILYLMGKFSGIPEFERYHFVTPEKSMERGIGVCGEVSMLMVSLLEREGIEADLITVPGHVMVSAVVDGQAKLFDPDFGVVLPFSPQNLKENALKAGQLYEDAGYESYDKVFFINAFSKTYTLWRGPEHFITKKYYFEYFAYYAKWWLPLLALLLMFLFIRTKGKKE